MADNNTNELDALMISELPTQATANETDLFEVAIVDANSASGYASKKESAAAIADAIVGEYQYPLRITGTTAKTIAGAINELKNLVDLLPQFAIEVVQTLPVSDISETTIYLVPASDPEQGNYYEEYIYVNNTWELVGTTAVDLSGYYTSAQVDTLLSAKANTSSLATVATSGAYADLSGKPTIDTALDTTSTNAVENRAVTSEINSIKSDITVDGSASGDIATFVDGSANPLKELEISIVATQSGSGDPAPDNVRAISGWTGCNANVSQGSVMLNKTVSLISINANDDKRYGIIIDTAGEYTFISRIISSCYIYSRKINTDQSYGDIKYIQAGTIHYKVTYTIASGEKIIIFNSSANASAAQTEIFLNKVYNVNAEYPITWQSTAGTVYGGTLNVKTGVLTVTHILYTFDGSDNEHWYRYNAGSASTYVMYIGLKDNIQISTQTDLLLKCNYLRPVLSNTTWGNYDYFVSMLNINNRLYTGYRSITTVEAWKAYLAEHPLQVLGQLVTPIEYDLTPTEIRSLLGVNNVWADCGAITELKYTRDLNLCINDIIARIEALEGASSSRSVSLSTNLTKSLTSDSDTAEGKTEETEEETKEEAQK